MRQVVGWRAREKTAASTSEVARFEIEILSQRSNLKSLQNMAEFWIDRVRQAKPIDKILLDMDSSVSETCGHTNGRRTTAMLNVPVIIPFFASIGSATWSGRCSEMATSTAPRIGTGGG